MVKKLFFAAAVVTLAACISGRLAETGIPAPAEAGPMSCSIRGRIVAFGNYDADTASVCSKHHCSAFVRVLNVYSCGSSVSLPLREGDTVEMHFVYTLDDTRKIFPSMKVQYPGLRPGDEFTAVAEQRLKPGIGGYFTIFDYKVE